MNEQEIKTLKDELEQYKKEKNEIRNIIGSIGGKAMTTQNKLLNIFFILLIAVLFTLDIMRHVGQIKIPLPPIFSIEIGLLLVSIKIIWMIHQQMKVEHFQFWILNSIEFRINGISNKLVKIENIMNDQFNLHRQVKNDPGNSKGKSL